MGAGNNIGAGSNMGPGSIMGASNFGATNAFNNTVEVRHVSQQMNFRKRFFRDFCRHLKKRGYTVDNLQAEFKRGDVGNTSQLQMAAFVNCI